MLGICAVLTLCSCKKDRGIDSLYLRMGTFHQQKTYVDSVYDNGISTAWVSGDKVQINDEELTITSIRTDAGGNGHDDNLAVCSPTDNEDGYYALFPSSIYTGSGPVGTSGNTVLLPAEQEYRAVTVNGVTRQNVDAPMAGYMEQPADGNGTLDMYNLCALVEIPIRNKLENKNLSILSIEVKATNATLCGTAVVDITSASGASIPTPQLRMTGTANRSVTLKMNGDDKPTIAYNATRYFYLYIPPVSKEADNRFTIRVWAKDENGKLYRLGYTPLKNDAMYQSKGIARSEVGRLPLADFDNSCSMELEGEGTEDDPYKIYNTDDLEYVAKRTEEGMADCDEYFIVMNDINCHGQVISPIGIDEYTPFAGHVNGQGYTISNYVIKASHNPGLFGCINCGSLDNITVGGNISLQATTETTLQMANMSPLCSYILEFNNETPYAADPDTIYVRNCHNKADFDCSHIKALYNGYVGGVVATTYGTNEYGYSSKRCPCVIENCSNSGNITGSQTSTSAEREAAGINTGKNKMYVSVGGIMGCSAGSSIVWIYRCSNSGDITNVANESSNVPSAAGIIASGTGSHIQDCHNSGKIQNLAPRVIGLAGICGGGIPYKIHNCFNTGDLSCTLQYTDLNLTGSSMGGIFGISKDNANKNIPIENCYSTGTIYTYCNNGDTCRSAGGILGNIGDGANEFVIHHCYTAMQVKRGNATPTILAPLSGDYYHPNTLHNWVIENDTSNTTFDLSTLNFNGTSTRTKIKYSNDYDFNGKIDAVMVKGVSYSNLLDALNAWCDWKNNHLDGTQHPYKKWEIKDGLPVHK